MRAAMNLYMPEQEIELCKADIEMATKHRDQHQRLVDMFNGQIAGLQKRIEELTQ